MSKESGIYLIENKVINKNYIGSAVNFDKRFYEHKWALKKNSHCNIHLQRSWNKYGKKSFVFKPYLFCNKKDLIFYEQLTIDAFVSRYGWKNVYNISPTAGSSLGRYHSEETKRKIGLKSKGRWTGKHHTEATKKKISLANLGKNLGKKASPEARRKMSESRKGKKFSDEWRKNLSNSLKRHYAKKRKSSI